MCVHFENFKPPACVEITMATVCVIVTQRISTAAAASTTAYLLLSVLFHWIYPFRFYFFSLLHSGVEMVGPKRREASGIILNYFYSVGEALVGLLFWLCPDWVILQLIVSVPPLLFIGYYWIIPESVRWLLARKDYTKARILIRKAAHVNGVELSEHKLQQFDLKSPTASEYVRLIHCIQWMPPK